MNGPFHSIRDLRPLPVFLLGLMETSIMSPRSLSLLQGFMYTLQSKSESRIRASNLFPGHSSILLSPTVQHSTSTPLFIDHITVIHLVLSVIIRLLNG